MFYIHLVNKKSRISLKAGVLVSLFCCIQIFTSCSQKDVIIASVDDTELTESDAVILMKHLGYNIADSSEFKSFVDFWVERQVFLNELKSIDEEKYRLVVLRGEAFSGELAKHYLEEETIGEQVNTEVTDSIIQDYYIKNKSDFALNDYIVKALYIKIRKEAPKQEDLKKVYMLKKDKDLTKVISYANLYAENFYFDDSSWIYFDELTKDIPVGKLNKDHIVLNRTKTHFEDDQFAYYINIIDYKLKDAAPPLDFMKNDIKQIIISQRWNEIQEKNESLFIQNCKNKHEIKINI